MKFKIGDRVRHTMFDDGVIEKIYMDMSQALVRLENAMQLYIPYRELTKIPNYKVGDVVEIRDDLVIGEDYGGYSWFGNVDFVAGMGVWKGQHLTINAVIDDETYLVKENTFYWTDGMIKGIAPNDYLNRIYVEDPTTRIDFTCDIAVKKQEKEEERKEIMELLELWKNRKLESIKRYYDDKKQIIKIEDKYVIKINDIKKEIEELKKEKHYEKIPFLPSRMFLSFDEEYFLTKETGEALYELTKQLEEVSSALFEKYEEIKAQLKLCETEESKRHILKTYKVLNDDETLNAEYETKEEV